MVPLPSWTTEKSRTEEHKQMDKYKWLPFLGKIILEEITGHCAGEQQGGIQRTWQKGAHGEATDQKDGPAWDEAQEGAFSDQENCVCGGRGPGEMDKEGVVPGVELGLTHEEKLKMHWGRAWMEFRADGKVEILWVPASQARSGLDGCLWGLVLCRWCWRSQVHGWPFGGEIVDLDGALESVTSESELGSPRARQMPESVEPRKPREMGRWKWPAAGDGGEGGAGRGQWLWQ